MSAGLLGVCQLSRLTYSRKQSKPSWVSWVSSACVIATNRVQSSRGCTSAGAGEGADAATAGRGRRRRSSAVLCVGMHDAAFGHSPLATWPLQRSVAGPLHGRTRAIAANEQRRGYAVRHCIPRGTVSSAALYPTRYSTPRGTAPHAAWYPARRRVHWGAKMARAPSHPLHSPTRTQRAQAPSERA